MLLHTLRRTLFISLCLFAVGCFFAPSPLKAQGGYVKKDIVPLSPNAAELGRYGQVPVSLYTGTPEVSVPLLELTERNLRLPVSLQYYAGGVQVDQRSSWVGLNWALNAGGVITRKVNGTYDENRFLGFTGVGYINMRHYPMNGGLIPDVDENAWSGVGNTLAYNAAPMEYYTRLWLWGVDPAPDEYTFNFMGRTGRFFITKDRVVVASEKIKIEYVINDVYYASWKITTEDGTQFFFAESERTRTRSYYVCNPGEPGRVDAFTAWYLTRITSADGSSIGLEYDRTYDQSYRNETNSTSEIYHEITGGLFPNCTVGGPQPYKIYQATSVSAYPEPVYLKKITTSQATLEFETMDASPGRPSERKLSKIVLKNKAGIQLKSFVFNYRDYQISTGKFLLTSVQEQKQLVDAVRQKAPYQFEYNEQVIPPVQDYFGGTSLAGVDYFGFYNGPANYSTRIPEKTFPYCRYSFNGIARTPNPAYVQAGMLKKIIYPTRGFTAFDYEPNDYSYVSNQLVKSSKIIAGGVRIARIITHDGLSTANDLIKTYSYLAKDNPALSSGVILNEVQTTFAYSSAANAYNGALSTNIWMDEPLLPTDLGYSQVTEQSSDGGKVVYQYTTAKDYPHTPFSDDGTFVIHNTRESIDFRGAIVAKQIFQRFTHPFTRSEGRFKYMRGLLLTKVVYNTAGKRLTEETNVYQPREFGRSYASASQGFDRSACMNGPSTIFFFHRYSVGAGRSELIHSEKKTYSQNDPANNEYVATTTTYRYDNAVHLQPTRIQTTTTELDGLIRRENTYQTFPEDYSDNSGFVKQLKDAHIVNAPIEKVVYLDDLYDGTSSNARVIAGQLFKYKPGGKGLLDEIYELETPAPIPLYNNFKLSNQPAGVVAPMPTPNQPFSPDARYGRKLVYTAYDTYGNPLQVSPEHDVPTAYIWGYNDTYPIAEVKNATYAEVEAVLTPAVVAQLAGASPGSDAQVRQALQVLRTDARLRNAQVTTYTYQPLVGMSSATDAAGVTTFYEHDELQRLKRVKDQDGNIIKHQVYHYKGYNDPEDE